jgi:protein subunit release factor B
LLHFMQIWSKTIQRSRSQHEKSQTHQNYLKQQAEEEKTKEKPMEIHRLKHLMPLAKNSTEILD